MNRIAVANYRGARIDRYLSRLCEAGLEPVALLEGASGLGGVRGLVLTGGIDIDPALYGAGRHEKVTDIDAARDGFELRLLREALDLDLPVLAICRGHQLLNVAMGGSLVQHLDSSLHEALPTEGRPSRSHDVSLLEGTRLRTWFGPCAHVNSRHHQAVTADRMAPGLVAGALTDDGLVEAAESREHTWVVGVQWHPEREEPQIPAFDASSQRLFAELAAAMAL